MTSPAAPPAPPAAIDPAAPPAEPVTPPTGEPAPPALTPEQLAAEVEKWKAFSRKHEDESKKNAAAAKRLADLEAANLSDLEKAQQRAATLEAENEASKAEAARLRVAVKHGIPAEDFDLLGTGSEAEIEARAARIAAKNAASKTPPANFDGGPRVPADPSDLPGQIAAAEKAGDRNLARRLKTQQLHEARKNL